ncbi:hypothetical protein DsansV1_C20g0163041 [Dioscorea sansibarensis]
MRTFSSTQLRRASKKRRHCSRSNWELATQLRRSRASLPQTGFGVTASIVRPSLASQTLRAPV